jgi:hypothetical protein
MRLQGRNEEQRPGTFQGGRRTQVKALKEDTLLFDLILIF